MQKRVGPKRVSLLEVGAGKVPMGILGQAMRAQKKRVGREFFASDIALRKEEVLRQRGLSKEPSNLKLVKGCSVKQLKSVPKGSKDIVFGSYFLNNYTFSKRLNDMSIKKLVAFLNRSKEALKPRGRIVMVQDSKIVKYFLEASKLAGLKIHVVKLSKEQMENSAAKGISMRSTPQKRFDVVKELLKDNPLALHRFIEQAKESDGSAFVKEITDKIIPVAIIMRK